MKHFSFTYVGDDFFDSNQEDTNTKHTEHSIVLGEDATWQEVCNEFLYFLRGVGYCFDLNSTLTVNKNGLSS